MSADLSPPAEPIEDGDSPLSADAAQVVSHLVALRGGAPFLSSLDSRTLYLWLSGGVPVTMILRALEDAAERRQKRRVKAPLSLQAAKASLKALRAAPPPAPPPPEAWRLYLERLAADGDPLYAEAAARLGALRGEGDALARQALEVCRALWVEAFERAEPAPLRAQAIAELGEHLDGLDEHERERVIEEVARAAHRRAWPMLSAGRIWDSLIG